MKCSATFARNENTIIRSEEISGEKTIIYRCSVCLVEKEPSGEKAAPRSLERPCAKCRKEEEEVKLARFVNGRRIVTYLCQKCAITRPGCPPRATVVQERTILAIDDEADVVTALESTLGDRCYDIRQASRWTEAITEIQEHRPDAILLDLYLHTVQVEALLEFIRDFDPSLPVVIVSSEIEPGKLEQLGRMGANGFVRKPFSEGDLFVVVEQVLSEVKANKADATTKSEDLGPVSTPTVAEPPKILPGAGVERLERDRPEIEAAPTRRTRRRGRRKYKIKPYLIGFLICLVATWMLYMAQEMLSQGFFGIDEDARDAR